MFGGHSCDIIERYKVKISEYFVYKLLVVVTSWVSEY